MTEALKAQVPNNPIFPSFDTGSLRNVRARLPPSCDRVRNLGALSSRIRSHSGRCNERRRGVRPRLQSGYT